jgi:hypothetical protein
LSVLHGSGLLVPERKLSLLNGCVASSKKGKHEVRTLAKDVCDILEIKNTTDAVNRLKSYERNTLVLNEGNRGNPNVNVISESGLYKLIFQSRKPLSISRGRAVRSLFLPSAPTVVISTIVEFKTLSLFILCN